jgi:TRAP transporter TAXI family solute receptor
MIRPLPAYPLLLLLLAGLLLAACSPAADGEKLAAAVQQRLDATFGERVLAVASLRRAGSSPLAAADDGSARRLVYFRARLELARDYDFTAWNSLNLSALANLLGATDRGVQGILSGGNRVGDELRVYGTVELVERGAQWEPAVAARLAPAPPIETAGPGQPPKDLAALARLNALLAPARGRQAERRRAIVDEEIERAIARIELRLGQLAQVKVLAGGPPGGAYGGVAEIIAAALTSSDGKPGFVALATDGSLENLRRLLEGSADLALVQSDLAAQAFAGQGSFRGEPPMAELRALASLFPETLHLVVGVDAGIRTIGDLRGKRVDIGLPGSGTRVHAFEVLAAAGLGVRDLAAAREDGVATALTSLEAGQLDALFVTVHPPAPQIQRLATNGRIRLLSFDAATVAKLQENEPYLVRVRLPVGTYPGVPEPINTVAVAALLVGTAQLPPQEAERVLTTLFGQIDFARAGSSAGSQVSRRTALDGVSIPFHEAAAQFLGNP